MHSFAIDVKGGVNQCFLQLFFNCSSDFEKHICICICIHRPQKSTAGINAFIKETQNSAMK